MNVHPPTTRTTKCLDFPNKLGPKVLFFHVLLLLLLVVQRVHGLASLGEEHRALDQRTPNLRRHESDHQRNKPPQEEEEEDSPSPEEEEEEEKREDIEAKEADAIRSRPREERRDGQNRNQDDSTPVGENEEEDTPQKRQSSLLRRSLQVPVQTTTTTTTQEEYRDPVLKTRFGNLEITYFTGVWDVCGAQAMGISDGYGLQEAWSHHENGSSNGLQEVCHKTKEWVSNAFGPFTARIDPNLPEPASFELRWTTSGLYTCQSLNVFSELQAIDSLNQTSNSFFSIVTIPYGEELGPDCEEGNFEPPTVLCPGAPPPPTEPPTVGKITVLRLIDVAEHTEVQNFTASERFVFPLDSTSGVLTMVAETEGTIGSVVFDVDGGFYTKVSDFAPFSLGGALRDQLLGVAPLLVSEPLRVVRVTPFSGTNGGGTEGETITIVLQLVDPLQIESVVYKTIDDTPRELTNGGTINLLELDPSQQQQEQVLLQAETSGPVESVDFNLNEDATHTVDGEEPYEFTDSRLNTPGHYILKVTPWTHDDGTGSNGETKRIEFDVVSQPGLHSVELTIPPQHRLEKLNDNANTLLMARHGGPPRLRIVTFGDVDEVVVELVGLIPSMSLRPPFENGALELVDEAFRSPGQKTLLVEVISSTSETSLEVVHLEYSVLHATPEPTPAPTTRAPIATRSAPVLMRQSGPVASPVEGLSYLSTLPCGDSPDNVLFYVSSAFPSQNCSWLASKPEYLASECNAASQAFFYCALLCGRCTR